MNLQLRSNPLRPSTCLRHPTKPVTGFCASCLRERLAGIDPATRLEISAPNRGCNVALRRSKSCSGAKPEAVPCMCELPRRKSCDVRVRSTLWNLFNIDDERNGDRKFEVEIGSLGFEVRENAASRREITGSGPAMDAIEDFVEEEIELKTMKEFIDLEWGKKKKPAKDFRDIAGSVWEAASVFSKKLRKWRQKQKMKSIDTVSGRSVLDKRTDNRIVRRLRETQSEIGEYGLGRRSCDIDPRLSVEAGRMSIDNPLSSFDKPRASWDGCSIGRPCPLLLPMASVMEEAKLPRIRLENYSINEEARGFDRSNSHRKASITEVDELKLISNAKVSPTTTELFSGAKLLIPEEDLNDTRSEVIKDCKLDENDCAPKNITTDSGRTRAYKWHKSWNVLRFVQKQSESSRENADESRAETNGSVSHELIRSCSVRNGDPSKIGGFTSTDIKGHGGRRREEIMWQKSRSVRYSPNNLDHGLLRFYLTPLRSYRKSKSGKSKLNNSHYISRNVI